MSDDFDKTPLKRFLISLVNNDDKVPVERKIFEELTKDITDEKHLCLLAKKAVQKTKKNHLQSYRDIDGLIQYLLELSKKAHSLGFVSASERIINLLVEDDNLLVQSYDDIAQTLKDLYGNEDKARAVLQKTYRVLQKGMESRKPFTVTDGDGTMDICNPNSKTMVRLGYVILNVLNDKDFANKVVAYSERFKKTYEDHIEIAQYYARYDVDKACVFYKDAEKQAFGFDELYLLAHHVSMIPSQRLWAMSLIERCLAIMNKSSAEEWCICAEIASRVDRKLSKEMFRKGYAVAKTDFERKSLKDSQEMAENSWTEEENGGYQ